MDPLIGRVLDARYRLVAFIGEGAMGKVYKAERADGTGLVAVKILNEDCSIDPALRERFEREARALFGLSHPHILDVQDYGVLDGRQPYLVMELLEGQNLEAMIESGNLDPQLALRLARQFLEGLAFAHSQGVLHRDLKTENLFVVRRPDGVPHVKLLDFGLVKFVDDERWGEGKKLTVAGSVMGSPAYMSPEQGTGGQMDARSDVYSAGVVLYEVLTGAWPFIGESRMDMLKQHLLTPVPPLRAGRPELRARPELDALITKAMAKEPGDRFSDAQAMLAAFDSIPGPVASLGAPVAPPPARPFPVASAAAPIPPPKKPMAGTPMAAPAPMTPGPMAPAPVPSPPVKASPMMPAMSPAPTAPVMGLAPVTPMAFAPAGALPAPAPPAPMLGPPMQGPPMQAAAPARKRSVLPWIILALVAAGCLLGSLAIVIAYMMSASDAGRPPGTEVIQLEESAEVER